MITCVFCGVVAAFGLYLLALCAKEAPHRRSSFFAVAELTFPRAAVFFDAAIATKCFGVSIRCVVVPDTNSSECRINISHTQLSNHRKVSYAKCR